MERACGGDEALRRAVQLLLAQNEKEDNFFETPAMEVAARHLAQQAGGQRGAPAGQNSFLGCTVSQMEAYALGCTTTWLAASQAAPASISPAP